MPVPRFPLLFFLCLCSMEADHLTRPFDYLVELEGPYLGPIDDSWGRLPRQQGAIAVDNAGNAYVASPGGLAFDVWKLSPDGKRIIYRRQIPGGSPYAIAVDPNGAVYVTGRAVAGFPFTTRLNGIEANVTGGAFLVRLEPDGRIGFATLLSRGPGNRITAVDAGKGIAIDRAGNVYVAGESATGIPVTAGAAQTERRTQSAPCRGLAESLRSPTPCADAFAMKFDAQGGLLYSTYLSGSEMDGATAVAVDGNGNAYVTGYTASRDFPVTSGALQAQSRNRQAVWEEEIINDVFVTKLSPDGRTLVYSTYIGGRENDRADGIAVDRQGRALICGISKSVEFPVEAKLNRGFFESANSLRPEPQNDNVNGFLLALEPTGGRIAFSTWFGDLRTYIHAIALDADESIYLAGYTVRRNFPTVAGPRLVSGKLHCLIQTRPFPERDWVAQCTKGFLTKLRPEAAGLVYSTLVGGEEYDQGLAVAVGPDGSAYTTGSNSKVLAVTHTLPDAGTNRNWYVGKMPPVKIPGGPFPEFGPTSIVNAASFEPALEPGSLYTVFGKNLLNREGTFVAEGYPLPKEVWGTVITVNGRPAPILSAVRDGDREQITFQNPWGGESEGPGTVVINNHGSITFQGWYPGGFARSGIFTWDNGRGIALHSADWTLITPENPAVPGEVITVYATGLGSVASPRPPFLPLPPDGEPAGTDPLRVCAFRHRLRVGPAAATTQFCGLAPGMVGVFQVNAVLDVDTPSGEQELFLELVDGSGTILSGRPVRISVGPSQE